MATLLLATTLPTSLIWSPTGHLPASRAVVHQPALLQRSVRMAEPTPPETTPSMAAPAAQEEWSDLALNVGLFVVLHSFFLTGAALTTGAPDGGTAASTAAGRGLALAAFVAVQQVRGLPVATWLVPKADGVPPAAPAALASPLAPLGAVALFGLVTSLPAVVATVAGAPETAAQLLPAARPLPGPALALDLLVAAPLEEEVFFRAWLLAAIARAGAPDGAAIAASSVLFALWHAGVAGDGGPLFFLLLGGGLGGLYQASGRDLRLPLATHALWNLAVVLGRAALFQFQ